MAPATVSVLLPRTLTSLAGGERRVEVAITDPASVADVLDDLADRFPVLERRLRDEQRAVRRFVNIYLDGEDIRRLQGTATALAPGQELRILQSIAGG